MRPEPAERQRLVNRTFAVIRLRTAVPRKRLKKCPICGKPTDPKQKVYPFCSERCQTIDLGNWASERYVAHSPLTEADEKTDPADRTPEDD